MDCILPRKKMDEIWVRTLSGFFAILFAVTATYVGFPYFDILGTVVLIGLLREWSRLAILSVFHPVCWVVAIQTLFTLYVEAPVWIHLGLIAASALFCLQWLMRSHPLHRALLFLTGCFYICIPTFVLMTLNHKGTDYRFFLLWMFSLIWATDVGAYFMGRMLKGPKLAPRISPNKTWAGFFGGIFWAVALGIGLNQYFHIESLLTIPFFVVLLTIPVAAHLGDLLESYIKRHFGVKDAGSLIPGHGGLLDRLDSLLLVGWVAGIFILFGWIQ
ncbi:MAG: phosphatidate cytidylyltransferase [Alphaproteobacteria bacterium]|nr:phosphatidate cytidylyltransferase [Alphaproteobacteria bacterium]